MCEPDLQRQVSLGNTVTSPHEMELREKHGNKAGPDSWALFLSLVERGAYALKYP